MSKHPGRGLVCVLASLSASLTLIPSAGASSIPTVSDRCTVLYHPLPDAWTEVCHEYFWTGDYSPEGRKLYHGSVGVKSKTNYGTRVEVLLQTDSRRTIEILASPSTPLPVWRTYDGMTTVHLRACRYATHCSPWW